MQVWLRISKRKSYGFSLFFLAFFLFFRDETVSWLPYSDSLWEMHNVIKQFPVCKWPVYTFLLQSLSLDRLLEYEKHSHRIKNENGRTSIMWGQWVGGGCLLFAFSAKDTAETDVKKHRAHYRQKKK